MNDEIAGQRLRSRKLHPAWVDAAERRLIARALHNTGCFTIRRIAELLQVSPTTISKDIADSPER